MPRIGASIPKTIDRHVRVTPEQWGRIENAAESSNLTANWLAVEALDRREWPRTNHEVRLLRSAIFTAQAITRDMIATGRGDEAEQIRRDISKVVPTPSGESEKPPPEQPQPFDIWDQA